MNWTALSPGGHYPLMDHEGRCKDHVPSLITPRVYPKLFVNVSLTDTSNPIHQQAHVLPQRLGLDQTWTKNHTCGPQLPTTSRPIQVGHQVLTLAFGLDTFDLETFLLFEVPSKTLQIWPSFWACGRIQRSMAEGVGTEFRLRATGPRGSKKGCHWTHKIGHCKYSIFSNYPETYQKGGWSRFLSHIYLYISICIYQELQRPKKV